MYDCLVWMHNHGAYVYKAEKILELHFLFKK